MADFIMLPDDTTGTNEWLNFGAVTHEECVQTDDDNTTYVYETRQGQEITFTMANPGVAEEDIDFNEDVTVQAHVTAHYAVGSGTVGMTIRMTGTGLFLGTYTASVAVDDSYPTYSGHASTFKSLGNVWDYTGLENVQVKLDCTGTPIRNSYLRVSYVYINVNYTPVVAVTDNATFFGSNF